MCDKWCVAGIYCISFVFKLVLCIGEPDTHNIQEFAWHELHNIVVLSSTSINLVDKGSWKRSLFLEPVYVRTDASVPCPVHQIRQHKMGAGFRHVSTEDVYVLF